MTEEERVVYRRGWEDRCEEDIRRIDSFKNPMALKLRLQREITSEQLKLVDKVVEAMTKLLRSHG